MIEVEYSAAQRGVLAAKHSDFFYQLTVATLGYLEFGA
ncbi:Uncharacterised protein [Mycobacteroides abscessus subsp. bolletii]|nr:Uncharacterised protein [Mycobacteroides abscessus subsp. bolletii]